MRDEARRTAPLTRRRPASGALTALLVGSMLQGLALLFYIPFDGLTSLYIVSAMFGLFQGGIVPSYTIIVREYFAPKEAGARVGLVLMATTYGSAAALAILIVEWWPLVTGFALAWVLRLMGLDPAPDRFKGKRSE